ncbi:MAG TPA: UvrD-helicase domain-containing protein [Micromonosporaceae bacterium]|nr:UvrD-helicase domain-containing protein [Micromonosporaceae bacterium]
MTDVTTLHDEIATEQRHLDRVYARVAHLRKAAAAAEADGYRIARVGTFGALVERDAMVFHQARRRYALDAEHDGLVFGRLDLRDGEVYHVGRLGVRDEDAEPLLIDWRAPAAAAFYQATAKDPRGVVRRRMIRCAGETVVGLEDDLLDPAAAPPGMRVVGDGALLAALARTTGRGMRDIVATIQREQDEAIRSPASGVTTVSGGPGTGKTAVALHRAAYLLYSDRARFAGGGVLVVGPSPVFVNYISQVLPSLGEESATLRALGSLVDGVRATRMDPDALAAIKGSVRMRQVLGRAARDAVPGAPTELRVLYRGELVRLTAGQLAELRRAALPRGARRNEVRRAVRARLLDALQRQLRSAPRDDFISDVGDRPEFRAFLRAWWPVVRPADALGWLADPGRLRGYAAGVLSPAEIEQLAGAFVDPEPTVADVALLDELDDLLGTPPAAPVRRTSEEGYRVIGVRTTGAPPPRPADYRDYAHIVVDEAQDVSPMQWRMLGRRGRQASWTVVGDPAQSAWSGDPAEVARARQEALGSRAVYDYALTTNYRNSAEIFALAARVVRQVLPLVELPRAVRETGVEPVHVLVAEAGLPDAVRASTVELLGAVAGTVGVISAAGRRAGVAGWVAGLDPDRLQVVTSLEAKGMEYDAVVLVCPGEVLAESASGVRTLYVALSRATQRLTTVGTDDRWLPAS